MIALRVILDGDNCWPDAMDKAVVEAANLEVAMLTDGTASGQPSVAIRCDLPDGTVVIAQTTLVLFNAAARAFRGRCEYLGIGHPDIDTEGTPHAE